MLQHHKRLLTAVASFNKHASSSSIAVSSQRFASFATESASNKSSNESPQLQTATKTRPFYLMHISDVHVWPNNFTPSWSQLLPNFKDAKRMQGYLNIKLTRGGKYSNNVLSAALQDMLRGHHLQDQQLQQQIDQQQQQHLIISGDITNLSLREEFEAARAIFDQHYFTKLNATAPLQPMWQLATAVPGNHDAYTPESVSSDWFGQYFGDTLLANVNNNNNNKDLYDPQRMYRRFPSVKRISNTQIVIVALNSSVPRVPFVSGGKLTQAMLDQASKQLQQVCKTEASNNNGEQQAWFKVCVLHHPPMQRHKQGYQEALRGFTLHDREMLTQFCKQENINLILSGHSHKHKVAQLYDTNNGMQGTLSADPGSGTYIGEKINKTARYNVYTVVGSSLQGIHSRVWQAATQTFETKELKW